jgi:hypothetical protein
VFASSSSRAANLIVEIERDPNNEKYSRAWSLWKFCGCSTATLGDGTIGGLGAVADLWSMGNVFSKMPYDVDYMPLDPFLVHLNTTWLYSDNFYSSVVADYLATENKKQGDTILDEAEVIAAENYVYDVLAKKVQEVHLDFVHVGWDTVDEEGVFSFITDFRGHLPVRNGDELCWDGMHMYNVSTANMESVMNVMGVGGLALDFHVNEGKNLCKDVTGW